MVKIRWWNDKKLTVERTKEVCGKDLSPHYRHCVDHIKDKEFFEQIR